MFFFFFIPRTNFVPLFSMLFIFDSVSDMTADQSSESATRMKAQPKKTSAVGKQEGEMKEEPLVLNVHSLLTDMIFLG